MVIYLVRHGETASNVERRFQGQSASELTPRGEHQARALGRFLRERGERFTRIYSSDLQRALSTARLVAAELALPVVPTRALREIDMGRWSGRLVDEVTRTEPVAWRRWRESAFDFRFPDGETLDEVHARVAGLYDRLVRERRGEDLLLVSHGAALSLLVAHACGWSPRRAWDEQRARHANTAFTRLTFDPARGEILSLEIGRTDHLRAPSG